MSKNVIESPIEKRSAVIVAWRMMERQSRRAPSKRQRWRNIIAKTIRQLETGHTGFYKIIDGYVQDGIERQNYVTSIKEKGEKLGSSRKAKKNLRGH